MDADDEPLEARRAKRPLLSGREAEIASLVARGLSNKDIAAQLEISGFTVSGCPHPAWRTSAAGRTILAMSSLASDLAKHEGTREILGRELHALMMGEYLAHGAEGVRRFITGLSAPART